MVLAVEPKFLGPDAVFYAVFARSIKVFMHLPLPLALAPSHHAPVGRRELHAQYPRDACCSRNPPLPHRSRHTTRASSPPERLRLLASHRLRSQLRPLPSWGRETHPLRPLLHPCPARARTMRIPICSDARQPSPARSQIQNNVGEGDCPGYFPRPFPRRCIDAARERLRLSTRSIHLSTDAQTHTHPVGRRQRSSEALRACTATRSGTSSR